MSILIGDIDGAALLHITSTSKSEAVLTNGILLADTVFHSGFPLFKVVKTSLWTSDGTYTTTAFNAEYGPYADNPAYTIFGYTEPAVGDGYSPMTSNGYVVYKSNGVYQIRGVVEHANFRIFYCLRESLPQTGGIDIGNGACVVNGVDLASFPFLTYSDTWNGIDSHISLANGKVLQWREVLTGNSLALTNEGIYSVVGGADYSLLTKNNLDRVHSYSSGVFSFSRAVSQYSTEVIVDLSGFSDTRIINLIFPFSWLVTYEGSNVAIEMGGNNFLTIYPATNIAVDIPFAPYAIMRVTYTATTGILKFVSGVEGNFAYVRWNTPGTFNGRIECY
jgi:hypothetical protein